MREYKFRGKIKETGEWVYGSLIKSVDNYFITEGYCEIGTFDHNFIKYKVIPETIGQYAGLKDKNGTEIYEEDIVKKEIFDDTKTNFTNISYAKVTYIEELAGFYLVNKENKILWEVAEDKYNIEVVGNIYDNPELLEKPNE